MRFLVGLWVLACVFPSCSPAEDSSKGDSGEDEPVDSSCEGAASHYWEICADLLGSDLAELFAEDFRVDCIAMEGFYVREARCAARADSCEALLRCEIGSVEFVCDTDEDCGQDLFCESPADDCEDCVPDTDCVACLEDEHCETGKSCFDGLCLGDANLHHETR